MGVSGTARSLALVAIRRVTEEGAYSNLVIPSLLTRSTLDRRDRAFAAELAYGTIRRMVPLDRAIDLSASRRVDRITPGALAAIRLGAYQLMYTEVAPHAAVSESVALAAPRERGFVNAVLRRVASSPPSLPEGGDDGSISVRTGLTLWAVGELRRLLGEDTEVAASALAEQAALCLRVNTCRVSVEEVTSALRDAGHLVESGSIAPNCLTVTRGGDPTALPGFDEGWFAVQDQASAFVVETLGPRPGERVWDACAGPGGKAAAIACAVGAEGVVVASDLHRRRAERVREQADRLGVRSLVLAQDARAPAMGGSFDRVLVDAPCSGIGAARRRPELLWRPQKRALSGLARLQVELVAGGATLLRPGGRLVYAVCTFPRAETDAVADAIVRRRPDLVPVETAGPAGPALRHRLWSHRHGTDGMFVAAFERIS
jgi:16S rRNA (cytosine967-C5)-methyltransferase